MKKLFLLALSLFSLSAIARPPIVWQGDNAWILRDSIRFHQGDTKLMHGNLNPSVTAVDASIGSMYIASTGVWYRKTDNGSSTNWSVGSAVAETDPIFMASPAQTITLPQISSWDIAYGWGNHASAGYWLEDAAKIASWDLTYSWGNHASAGYGLLGYPKIIDAGANNYISLVTSENNASETSLIVDVGGASRSLRMWNSLYTGGSLAAESTNFVLSNEATAGDALAAGGANNTAIGIGAMSALSTGDYVSAFGYGALGNATGGQNTAVGMNAGGTVGGGYNDTYIGSESGANSASSRDSTCVGKRSCAGTGGTSAANYNTSVGSDSLTAITTGDQNTAIGYNAASNLTTGSRNLYLGEGVLASAVGVNDELRIGSSVNPTMISGSMATGGDLIFDPTGDIVASGSVGIYTATPSDALEVVGTVRADTYKVNYGAEPASAAGMLVIWASDDKLYFKDASGVNHEISTL